MFVHSFYFVNYYFLELNDDFLKKFQETYNSRLRKRYGDNPSTHQISIQICGWRWDRLVDPKKIGSVGSPTLRPKTCCRPVVSQPLRAFHQYRAPSLRSSLPWNNNNNNSRRIMISSVKWSWRWDQRWLMIHVQLFFCRTVPGTTILLLLLQLRRYSSLILFIKHIKFVINIWMNIT